MAIQCGAESDPPAGAKNRMPAEFVSWILAMPIDKPDDIVMPSFLEGEKNMAEILGVTEEWLEDKRQVYRDAALRYQVEIRDEFLEKGYVEVDDDYFEHQAEIGETMRAYWEELQKKRGPTLAYVADYSEYYLPYDYEEQATRLVDL
ncbi:hypothetical protein VPH35_062551 [Triticum aestivum]